MSHLNLKMTVMRRDDQGQNFYTSVTVEGTDATIGRSIKSNHALVLEGTKVSRNHAELTYRNGYFSIIDGSSTGTVLNGERLTKGAEVRLSHGDRLKIANYHIELSISTARRERTTEPTSNSLPESRGPKESKHLPTSQTNPDIVLEGLLKGLGLEDELGNIDADEKADFAQLIGLLLRDSLSGIVGLLNAREEFRRSYSSGRSRIQRTGNIMYWATDTRTLLKYMLFEDFEDKIPQPEMLAEVLEVLQFHELGMIAAFEGTITGIIDTFDPVRLEQELERLHTGLLNVNAFAKWSQYIELYATKRETLKEQQNPYREIVAHSYEQALLDVRRRSN